MKKIPCEVFSRVVGYYRPLQNWNAGKIEEYNDRKFFDVEQKIMTPCNNCGQRLEIFFNKLSYLFLIFIDVMEGLIMKNLLFTTQTCPNCPAAKVFLDVSGIDFDLVDASKPEGLNLARKYGVGSVPTLIVVDDKGGMTDSASGLDDIEALIEK